MKKLKHIKNSRVYYLIIFGVCLISLISGIIYYSFVSKDLHYSFSESIKLFLENLRNYHSYYSISNITILPISFFLCFIGIGCVIPIIYLTYSFFVQGFIINSLFTYSAKLIPFLILHTSLFLVIPGLISIIFNLYLFKVFKLFFGKLFYKKDDSYSFYIGKYLKRILILYFIYFIINTITFIIGGKIINLFAFL